MIFFGLPPAKADCTTSIGQHRRFDLTLIRIAGNCQIAALLAVDLHGQHDVVLDDQRLVAYRPGASATRPSQPVPTSIPRQMRGHRRDDLDEDPQGLGQGGGLGIARLAGGQIGDGRLQDIEEFIDAGNRAVEAELVEIGLDGLERLVGGLRDGKAGPSWAGFGEMPATRSRASDTSRQTRWTKRCAPSTPAPSR